MTKAFWTGAVALCLLTIGVTRPASAFDPTGNAVADAYIAAYVNERAKIVEVSGVEETDGVVRIARFIVEYRAVGDDGKTSVPSIRIDMHDTAIYEPLLSDSILRAARIETGSSRYDFDSFVVTQAADVYTDVALTDGDWSDSAGIRGSASTYSTFAASDLEFASADATYATASQMRMIQKRTNADAPNEQIESRFEVDHLIFDGNSLADAAETAELAALEAYAFDAGWDILWSGEEANIRVAVDVAAESLGAMTASATFGRIPAEWWDKLDAALIAEDGSAGVLLGELSFLDGSLTVRDEGAMKSFVAFGAARRDWPPGVFRSFVANLLLGTLAAFDDPIFRTRLAGGLDAILNGNSTLTVRADPAQALPLNYYFGGLSPEAKRALPSLLRLSAESTTND